jgi:Lipoprotein LpqB beta-propeller domain/WD40-like Beta Propeller Repeat
VALDERLRRAIEHAGEPADPSGVYEGLIRRRERRRIRRRVGSGLLALAVVAGTTAGVFALSKLFGGPGEDEVTPPVSPTGAANGLVAFTTGDRIIMQAVDGSDPHEVPAPAPGLTWHIAWSPDGTRLAVAIFDGPRRSLWVMRADGSEATEIANGENVSRPSWHPNGTHITYSLERNGRTEVHVTRSDGTNDRVLYSEPAPGTYAVFSATFSPDGSRIVFDAGTDSEYNIFVMASDGSNVRQLTETGTDYNPAWSPDGSRIVFIRYEAISESDVFVMDADGSDVRRLTDHGSRFTNIDPQFSPDGAFITYGSAENGVVGLSIMAIPTGGSDPEVLVEGEVIGFSWQPVPDAPSDLPQQTEPPTPSPSDGASEDIGLGFPVCNVSSIEGHFATPNSKSTVLVATRASDLGDCPQPEEAFNVVALDVDRDGLADTSYGPIECTLECRAFSAPELDADGTAELLIVQSGGSILGLGLFDVSVRESEPVLEPVTVASPGDPAGGFEPGEVVRLLLGGDEFYLDTLRCGDPDMRHGPGLIVTTAESLPHDSPDARWHAHTTVFALVDESLQVMDIGDFTEPAGVDAPSFQSGEMLCGSNLGP